jgi:hypothetical protein
MYLYILVSWPSGILFTSLLHVLHSVDGVCLLNEEGFAWGSCVPHSQAAAAWQSVVGGLVTRSPGKCHCLGLYTGRVQQVVYPCE